MSTHQSHQPRAYSDGVTRTPGVSRWEYISGLFMPTPGAAARDDWDDDGGSLEVHCYRTPDTDLRGASFRVRLSNDETGEDAAVVVPQSALIALASRLLDAALRGLPVGLTDGEYHGYYYDEDGHQRFHDEGQGDGDAPGTVLRFPERGQGDDTPGGAA